MADEKVDKKPTGIKLETATQSLIREGLKRFVNWLGTWVEQSFPELFLPVAWIYTSKTAENLKRWTDGSILAGATLVENIADVVPLPSWVREAIESIGGDLTGNLKNYFELREARGEIKFPDGYTGPKLGDVQKILREFAQKFREGLRQWLALGEFAKLIKRIDLMKALETLGLGKADVILGAILLQDEVHYPKLARIVRKWQKSSPQDLHVFTRMDKLFADPEGKMLAKFIDMTPAERREFMEMEEANRWRLLSPDQAAAFKQWRRDVNRKAKRMVAGVSRATDQGVRRVNRSIGQRQNEVQRTRYTREQLDRHPGLLRELDPTDIRRIEAEGRQPKWRQPHTWRIGVPHWMFLALVIVISLISMGAWWKDQNGPPPQVTITSPHNNTITEDSTMTVSVDVLDDGAIQNLEYSINDGNRIKVATDPLSWMTKHFEVTDLPVGYMTIAVYARDNTQRVGASEVSLLRKLVVPNTTSTISDRGDSTSAPAGR